MKIEIYIIDDTELEEFKTKRYIPSREDYTEPLDTESLKEKGMTEKEVRNVLRHAKNERKNGKS
jgi:hypothetical protein